MSKPNHRWDLSPTEAISLQRDLASRIKQTPLKGNIRFVGGSDCAFTDGGKTLIAGWVVWDLEIREPVEQRVAEYPLSFPYVPGLLSFRECPGVLATFKKLRTQPDACIFDGQGIAHPRRIGLASHAGLWLGLPSIGCAKSRLCGEHVEPGRKRGAARVLTEKNECIGRVLRTRDGVKPVYISVGHLITLDDAVSVVLRCVTKYRLPEPTRLADRLVAEYKRNRVKK